MLGYPFTWFADRALVVLARYRQGCRYEFYPESLSHHPVQAEALLRAWVLRSCYMALHGVTSRYPSSLCDADLR